MFKQTKNNICLKQTQLCSFKYYRIAIGIRQWEDTSYCQQGILYSAMNRIWTFVKMCRLPSSYLYNWDIFSE